MRFHMVFWGGTKISEFASVLFLKFGIWGVMQKVFHFPQCFVLPGRFCNQGGWFILGWGVLIFCGVYTSSPKLLGPWGGSRRAEVHFFQVLNPNLNIITNPNPDPISTTNLYTIPIHNPKPQPCSNTVGTPTRSYAELCMSRLSPTGSAKSKGKFAFRPSCLGKGDRTPPPVSFTGTPHRGPVVQGSLFLLVQGEAMGYHRGATGQR